MRDFTRDERVSEASEQRYLTLPPMCPRIILFSRFSDYSDCAASADFTKLAD